MSNSRRILIIAHSYAPVIDPRSFRWTSVAEELARRGHGVTVISAWYPGSERDEIRHGVRVIRTGGNLTQRIRTKLLREDRLTSAAVAHVYDSSGAHKPSRLARMARWLHDHTWKSLYWPDHALLWYSSAVAAGRRVLGEGNTECLISVSEPFSGQIVGRKLHRLFPGVRWVIDLGDPFCFRQDVPPNNQFLYRRLNFRVERKIFEEANAASVTTEGTRKKYAELFPGVAQKIAVIPPLISSKGSITSTSTQPAQNRAIRFLYTGTLYKAIRNPAYMLKLVERVQSLLTDRDVELHVMGAINDCHEIFTPYLEAGKLRVVLHGVVKRNEVFSAMSSADMLINIANDNPYQLPSKVVDYAFTGRPVVNIARRAGDSCDQFFQSYPEYCSIIEQVDGPTAQQVEAVANFVRVRRPDIPQSLLESFLAPYQVNAVVGAYESLILGGSIEGNIDVTRPRISSTQAQ